MSMVFIFSLMNFFFIILPVLINVAFVTLLERKILGYSQLRKGPNKVSYIGLLQPISDAVKLFSNQNLFMSSSNYLVYYLSPMTALLISMLLWFVFPLKEISSGKEFSWILLVMIMSVGIYPLLMSGWSSNSKYSLLGAIRGVAQIISYEVVFILVVFVWVFFSGELSLMKMMEFSMNFFYVLLIPFMMIVWLMACLAETNRTPFDFAEGESELVSGFNTEYMSGMFALIFMAEYMSILFLSMLTMVLVMSSLKETKIYLGMVVVVFFWMWVRSTYPRHRYDLLMFLSWKSLMPMILIFMMVFLVVSIVD